MSEPDTPVVVVTGGYGAKQRYDANGARVESGVLQLSKGDRAVAVFAPNTWQAAEFEGALLDDALVEGTDSEVIAAEKIRTAVETMLQREGEVNSGNRERMAAEVVKLVYPDTDEVPW